MRDDPARATPVVLLHGLGRRSRSLARLAIRLQARGHATASLDYPSRREGVAGCARFLLPEVMSFQDQVGAEIAFVTHSMGGLVARVLAGDERLRVRAIVMLAPPNQGSEVADFAYGIRFGRWLLGPALGDLRTGILHPRPTCPIGIVAGTRRLPLTSRLIAGPNDGLVSFERSRLPESDWICVPAAHTFVMNHPDIAEAASVFVQDGAFPARLRIVDRRPVP